MTCQYINVLQNCHLSLFIVCGAFPPCYGVSSQHVESHQSSCCSHDPCQGHATCVMLKWDRASRDASSLVYTATVRLGRDGSLHGMDPHRSPQNTCTMSHAQPSSCWAPAVLCTCGQHVPIDTNSERLLYLTNFKTAQY